MSNVTITQEEYDNLLAAKAFQESAVGKVLVNQKEYDELWEERDWLYALEAAGVDNWNGYGEAHQILKEMQSEKKDE